MKAPSVYHQGSNSGRNEAEAINYGDACSAARTCGYRECRAGQCYVLPLTLRLCDESGGGNGDGSSGKDDDDSERLKAALGLSSLVLGQWAVQSGRQDVLVIGLQAVVIAVQSRRQADKALKIGL